MSAAMKVHKEGELVVMDIMDIEDWENDPKLQRISAVIEWAEDSNRQGIRAIIRLEVPKEHFIELWKFWSQAPPEESDIAEWTKWLQNSS